MFFCLLKQKIIPTLIKIITKHIPDNKLQVYFKSANLIISPYKEVLNSGLIFLSLTFKKPILVPNTKTFKEIKKDNGKNLIYMYHGSINKSKIEKTLNEIKRKNKIKYLSHSIMSWKKIAILTIDAYKEVLNAK